MLHSLTCNFCNLLVHVYKQRPFENVIHFCHTYANVVLLKGWNSNKAGDFWSAGITTVAQPGRDSAALTSKPLVCWSEREIIGLWWLLFECVLWQMIITSKLNIVQSEPGEVWETSVWSPPPIYVNFLISKTSCFSFLAVSMLQLLRLWPLVAASTMLCLITAPSSSPEILNTPTNQSSNIFMSNQEYNMLKQTSVVAKRALHAATSENTWKWVNWEKTYALQVERITKYMKEFRGKT